jgi:hypothetical protein
MCKVRCAECGLLALQRKASRELVEVELTIRESWKNGIDVSQQYERYERSPVCFVDAANLESEHAVTPINAATTAKVVNRERECDRFTKRVPRKDQRWHQDQIMLVELQKHEDERKRQDRRWMEEQKEADRRAREEDKQADRAYQEAQKEAEFKRQDNIKMWDRVWQVSLFIAGAICTVGSYILGKWLNS